VFVMQGKTLYKLHKSMLLDVKDSAPKGHKAVGLVVFL
jgi:hypothetical protein